jgi:hypothetical protein
MIAGDSQWYLLKIARDHETRRWRAVVLMERARRRADRRVPAD